MSEPVQSRENDQASTLSVRRVRLASISNPYLGLVTWLDEFDGALVQQDFACCRSLLLEIQEEGYTLTQQEQAFVESRRAAFSFCLGLDYHLRHVYGTARQLYEASRDLHHALGNMSGEGQTLLALEELEKEPAMQDVALLEQLAATPWVLGDSNALLTRRLTTLPLVDQLDIIEIAKQCGYVQTLQAALRSSHPQVQAAASAALTWLEPGPDYQTVLSVMLNSPNWLVRWQATRLLQKYIEGGRKEFTQALESIGEALAQRLKDGEADPLVRHNIALLLLKLKNTSDTSLLVKLLDDPDPDVRLAAVEALAGLGDEQAIAPLQQVQAGVAFFGNDVAEAAGRAVLQIQRRLPPAIQEVALCLEITEQRLPVQSLSRFSVQEPPRYCVVTLSNWTPRLEVICQVSGREGVIFREESARTLRPTRTAFPSGSFSPHEEDLPSSQADESVLSSSIQEPLIIPSEAFVASTPQVVESGGASSQDEEEVLIELVASPVSAVRNPVRTGSYEERDLAFIAWTLENLLKEFFDIEQWLELATNLMDAAGDQLDESGADILGAVKDLIEAARDLVEDQGETIIEMLQPLAEVVQTLSEEHGEDISAVMQAIRVQTEQFMSSLRGANQEAVIERSQRFFSELFIERGEEIAIIIQPFISELEALIRENKERFLELYQSLSIPLGILKDILQEKFLDVIQPLVSFLQNFFNEHEQEFSAMVETRSMQELGEQISRLRYEPRGQIIAQQLFSYWVGEITVLIQPSIEDIIERILDQQGDFLSVIMPLIDRARALCTEQRAEFSLAILSLVETARDQVDRRRDELSALVEPLTHLVERIKASLEGNEEIGLKSTPISFTFPSTGIAWSPGDYHLEITLNKNVAFRQAFQIV